LLIAASVFIYFKLKNRSSIPKISEFIIQTENLNPTVMKDVSIKYMDVNHYKTRISPYASCDIYLFDDFLAIIRRQRFIFTLLFEPKIIINKEIQNNPIDISNFNTSVADSFKFTNHKKDEIIIKYTDKRHSNFKTEIVLRKLTSQQVEKLKVIENWATS
jgi:hypothetical protein